MVNFVSFLVKPLRTVVIPGLVRKDEIRRPCVGFEQRWLRVNVRVGPPVGDKPVINVRKMACFTEVYLRMSESGEKVVIPVLDSS